MKKIVSVLLVALLALLPLAGCGSDDAGTGSGTGDGGGSTASEGGSGGSGRAAVVNVGLYADIPTLDPFATSSVGGLHIYPEIYQTLFYAVDFGGEALPVIGKSYQISDDYLSCDVEIFDYVYDSQGNHITASDVVFSFEQAKSVGAVNQTAYYDSVEATGEYSLRITANTVKLGVWEEIFEVIYIVSEDAYDETAFITKPIGSGPYVVTDYVAGSYINLKANDDFWQTDPAYLNPINQQNVEVINYKIIIENAQMSMALETGDIDLATQISAEDLYAYFAGPDGSANAGYTILSHATNLFNNMGFNMAEESRVSQHPQLRQAILYAINNAELIQGVLSGDGEQLYTWGGSMYGDFNSQWANEDYYNYDVDKANALLDEAGFADVDGDGFREYPDGSALEIRIMHETNDTKNRAAQIIQGYMLQIGVNSTITQYDAALFSTYKLTFDEWDMILDNQANRAYLTAVWSNYFNQNYTEWQGQGTTYNGLHNDELQELVSTAGSVEGFTQDNVDKVHYWLKDNAVAYGLWAATNFKVAQEGITDIMINSKMYVMVGACTFADSYQSKG